MWTNGMSREELLSLLDGLASGETSLLEMQQLLGGGPERRVVIERGSISVQLIDPKASFIWNVRDPRTAAACLAAVGSYEANETEILKSFASRSQVVLDVGANIGYYAVILALSMSPTSKLYCFEPMPDSVSALIDNLNANHLHGQVEVCPVALSNMTGESELFLPLASGSSATSMRALHADEENLSLTVPVRRLDDLVWELGIDKIDLMKMDVEGAEKQVLEGAWETIGRLRPVVFAELLRKWSAGFGYHPDEVVQMFASIGYECWAVGRTSGVRAIRLIDEETEETNFLFLPIKHPNSALHTSILKRFMAE